MYYYDGHKFCIQSLSLQNNDILTTFNLYFSMRIAQEHLLDQRTEKFTLDLTPDRNLSAVNTQLSLTAAKSFPIHRIVQNMNKLTKTR